VRREWPQLTGALALTALIAWADNPVSVAGAGMGLTVLWCACWMYVGASVIAQERIPGERQYWLTRPYDWRRLLAAKGLYVLVFATLPLVAAKAAVLAANGVSPLGHAAAILSSSLILSGAIGLVAGALAAVTGSLMQFLWGVLVLATVEAGAIALGVDYNGGWSALLWTPSATLGTLAVFAGVPVLLLQCGWRRTFVSRAVLSVAALISAAVPFGRDWHGERAFGELPVELAFDSGPRPRLRYVDAPILPGAGREALYVPIRISGIPAGDAVVARRVDATVEASGRRTSSRGDLAGTDPLADAHLFRSDGAAWLYLDLDRAFCRTFSDAPVRIRISATLVLLGDLRIGAVEARGRTGGLPLDGICDVSPIPMPRGVRGTRGIGSLAVTCAWPRPGPQRAYVRLESPVEDSRALLTTGAGGWLTTDAWDRGFAVLSARAADRRLSVETWRAAACREVRLEISAVRLRDYVVPRSQ